MDTDIIIAARVLGRLAIYDEPHHPDDIAERIHIAGPDTVKRIIGLLRAGGLVKADEYELTKAGERWLDDRFIGKDSTQTLREILDA
jgi:predicted transcriptional regulator